MQLYLRLPATNGNHFMIANMRHGYVGMTQAHGSLLCERPHNGLLNKKMEIFTSRRQFSNVTYLGRAPPQRHFRGRAGGSINKVGHDAESAGRGRMGRLGLPTRGGRMEKGRWRYGTWLGRSTTIVDTTEPLPLEPGGTGRGLTPNSP